MEMIISLRPLIRYGLQIDSERGAVSAAMSVARKTVIVTGAVSLTPKFSTSAVGDSDVLNER